MLVGAVAWRSRADISSWLGDKIFIRPRGKMCIVPGEKSVSRPGLFSGARVAISARWILMARFEFDPVAHRYTLDGRVLPMPEGRGILEFF